MKTTQTQSKPIGASAMTLDALREWLRQNGIKTENFLTILQLEETQNPQTFNKKLQELFMLMRKSQIQTSCQSLMLQSFEQNCLSADINIEQNPLLDMIELSQLSKTGSKDVQDLTQLLMDSGVSPAEDMMFQFETIAEKLQYEHQFLDLKNKKLQNKLDLNLKPRQLKKQDLKDVLEALFEGRIKHEGKQLGQYAAKMQKDVDDKQIQLMDKQKEVEIDSQVIQNVIDSGNGVSMDLLERYGAQLRELEHEIAKMNDIIKVEYAELPNDVTESKIKIAQYKEDIKVKEEQVKRRQ